MSDTRDPERDQVLPIRNDGPSCHDLVIKDLNETPTPGFTKYHQLVGYDLIERKEFGLQKYNSPLQPNNGRSMILDAYEESLDLAVYLRGAVEEDKQKRRFDEWTLTLRQSMYESHLKVVLFLRRELEIERLQEAENAE